MKKLILCVSVYLIAALQFKYAKADGPVPTVVTTANVDKYCSDMYKQIDFGSCTRMDEEVFNKAYHGYLNLQAAGKLNNDKQLLTVCDMSKSSTTYRLWVIDLANKKVLVNDYVAHGQGSGNEFATAFSNRENSHQTSLGFYVTDQTYIGKHGLSLHLRGMDQGFNNSAYERDVVVHGAEYVSPSFVAGQGKLGRSWGCPAVSTQLAPKLISMIKDGTCLFIYYPEKNYLQTAYWLNKKVDHLPGGTDMFNQYALANTAHDSTVANNATPLAKEL